jgi:hypothetical protein
MKSLNLSLFDLGAGAYEKEAIEVQQPERPKQKLLYQRTYFPFNIYCLGETINQLEHNL